MDYETKYFVDETISNANEETDSKNGMNILLEKSSSTIANQNYDLTQMRENIINDFSDISNIKKDEAIIVLNNYKWDFDKACQNWFENIKINKEKFGLDMDENSIKLTKDFREKSNCLICDVYLNEKNSFSLNCSHRFCISCWKKYILEKLDDMTFTLKFGCPLKNCNLIINESELEKFLKDDKKNMDKFHQLKLKNFREYNTKIKNCPDCGKYIISEDCIREIKCECKNIYCFSCLREGHRPSSCDMMEAWEKRCNSDVLNLEWIKINTKQCPNCNTYIEKDKGCNSVICSEDVGGCGIKFCWVCLKDWEIHENYGFYNCNMSDINKIKCEEKSKKEFDNFMLYYNQYIEYENRNKQIQIFKIEELYNDLFNITISNSHFIQSAKEIISKGLKFLRYSCIVGYFLKNDCSYKTLFEFNRNFLETYLEFILCKIKRYKEFDDINLDFEQFSRKFDEFKDDIIRCSAITEKFIESLKDDVEVNTVNDLRNFSQEFL